MPHAVTTKLPPYGLPSLHDPMGELSSNRNLHACTKIDGHCAVPWAPLKKEPLPSAETVSELLFGEPVEILVRDGGWAHIASITDGYKGWIREETIAEDAVPPTHRIIAPMTHVYRGPDLKSEPLLPLPMGGYVTAGSKTENGFMPLATGGFVFAKHLARFGESASDPVTVTEGFIGTPYLWGGRTKMGIDCSGLVQLALAACGHRVLRDSGSQFKSLGNTLEDGETPQRGDLAFFPGHVGFMIDGIHLIHANATNMAVTIDPVNDVTKWVSQNGTEQPFLGFKRL